MKIGIIGAGAMGLLASLHFKKADIDFVIYEKNPDIISLIKINGINIINDSNQPDQNFSIKIDDNPLILSGCKIIFVFVKSYSTEEAVKSVFSNLMNDTLIVSLQNGIGNIDIIKKYFDDDRIISGTISYGASKTDLNTLKPGGHGQVIIGGKNKKNVLSVIELLGKAGFTSIYSDNPEETIWKKAILNAGINPVAAILSIPNGEILKNEYALYIQKRIISEAVFVAKSININLHEKEMIDLAREVCMKTSSNKCSMYQDIINNRTTEIESINGKIIEFGKNNSIPTPCNEIIYYIIKAIEKLNKL